MDRNGVKVSKPFELTRAELIDSLCQRYGVLPSQLLEEDASIITIATYASMRSESSDG